MKKILFLMLIMGAFSPLINAYEYLYFERFNLNIQDLASVESFYIDNNGYLKLKNVLKNGSINYRNVDYATVNACKYELHSNGNYTYYDIKYYLKNDKKFLNDFYTQYTNIILNYFYNDGSFNNTNYIFYDNYQILYNDEGLAVESIVDNVWAGLYDDSQKNKSGALYDSTGSLIYYNGKPVDPVTSFLVWLKSFTHQIVLDAFMEIKRSVVTGIIMTVVLTLALVRFVLLFLPSAISRSNYGRRSFRSGGGGGGSLPDFGDGRAVSASVRERLAAKNRSLKQQSDRSGVTQSLENGILFNLEEK